MIKKQTILILLFSSSLFFSCSNKTSKKVLGCDLIGDLKHVQYWNKYDKWDLSSLSLVIKYEDDSVEYIKGDNSLITYNFLPESPSNLPIGNTSFKIYDSFYTSEGGERYNIPDKEFTDITIVDYPYSNTPRELYDSGIINRYILPAFICLSIMGLGIGLAISTLWKKEVKKSE